MVDGDESGHVPPSEALIASAQIGPFLRSRRERLTAEEVGLPDYGRRRASGLRREEVAALAGISPAWYTHLEQGRDVRPSREVLDALAAALRLDRGERAYLFELAFGRASRAPRHGRPAHPAVVPAVRAATLHPTSDAPDGTPPHVRRLLTALASVPGLAVDRCWDVIGRNAALAALIPDLDLERTTSDAPPRNVVQYLLTNPAARGCTRIGAGAWAATARRAVDGLRASLAGLLAEYPDDRRAATLLRTLERTSPEFRAWWPEHGLWTAEEPLTQVYEHPRVGRVECEVTFLDIRSAPGLTLIACVPCDPASADRLERLWRAAAASAHPP